MTNDWMRCTANLVVAASLNALKAAGPSRCRCCLFKHEDLGNRGLLSVTNMFIVQLHLQECSLMEAPRKA